jgi:hypothetical protein
MLLRDTIYIFETNNVTVDFGFDLAKTSHNHTISSVGERFNILPDYKVQALPSRPYLIQKKKYGHFLKSLYAKWGSCCSLYPVMFLGPCFYVCCVFHTKSCSVRLYPQLFIEKLVSLVVFAFAY